MIKVELCGHAAGLAAVALGGAALAACGDVGVSSSHVASNAGTVDRSGDSAAMDIKGTPASSAAVGKAYSFQPTVSNAASTPVTGSTLTYTIANCPGWAKFDAASGKLTGTPATADVGSYSNIRISVSSGTASVALPAFEIAVIEGNPQRNVTLSWQPPMDNADGSPLVDLKGYRVHYGPTSRGYAHTIQVANAGLTTYVVQDLEAGRYYFAISAYNEAGKESEFSPEVATQVD